MSFKEYTFRFFAVLIGIIFYTVVLPMMFSTRDTLVVITACVLVVVSLYLFFWFFFVKEGKR